MLRLLALLLAAAFLSGCDSSAMFERFIPKEESAAAQDVVAKIAARDHAAIDAMMDPAHRPADLPGVLDKMSSLLPAVAPKSVRTVGANTMHRSAATTYDLTLEYEYPDSWLVAGVVFERRDDRLYLQGVTLLPRKQSMAEENRFTLQGKGPLHYVVLALAVVIPLFILYALVCCIRTRGEKRKWLWLLCIAVGVLQFRLDWASGAWDVQLLSFQLLGAGVVKSGPVSPWVLSVGVPLGAILFLIRRHALRRADAHRLPPA